MKLNPALFFTSAVAVCGVAVFWIEIRPAAPSPTVRSFTRAQPPSPQAESTPSASTEVVSLPARPEPAENVPAAAIGSKPEAPAETVQTADELAREQTIAWLISPQANFLQKQAAWAAMRGNPGQIDHAIAWLERQAKENPTDAEIPAQLGLAYLMKISTSRDVREQGMGGMKADLSFDAALKIDPANWSANFLKAQALMHWPDSMNMGPQVVQRFAALIEQQESQPSRPEFAMTYQLLGEQYQKTGQTEAAVQIWTRGLSYFPGSRALAQKLNPAP